MTTGLGDRVKETTVSTGTTAVLLAGATAAYRSFAAVFPDQALCYYCIADQSGTNWEVGQGSCQAGTNSLARTTVYYPPMRGLW